MMPIAAILKIKSTSILFSSFADSVTALVSVNPALIKGWNDWHFCVHRPFNLSYDYKYACPLDLRTILKKKNGL